MILNSLICKLINVQASMKEKNEKKIKNCDEISKVLEPYLGCLEVQSESFHRSSLDSITCYPSRATFQRFTDYWLAWELPREEKERCSGSFHLAVGLLVMADDSISERPS